MKSLFRYFSYAFHALIAIFLTAVSGFALASGAATLRLNVLPWTGPTLTYVALGAGLAGLACVALAVFGQLRWLFFLWSVVVLLALIKGFVFSGYYFEPGALSNAVYLMVAALLAAYGAYVQMRAPRFEKKRY